jgi:hypothetical protein
MWRAKVVAIINCNYDRNTAVSSEVMMMTFISDALGRVTVRIMIRKYSLATCESPIHAATSANFANNHNHNYKLAIQYVALLDVSNCPHVLYNGVLA